jgi:hypothetical protein
MKDIFKFLVLILTIIYYTLSFLTVSFLVSIPFACTGSDETEIFKKLYSTYIRLIKVTYKNYLHN